jgi:hypothetical protein
MEGGTERLIPRAIAIAIEDVMLYGGAIQNIPKMIENYEVNNVKNVLRASTEKIHAKTMEVMGMDEAQAWQYMNRPEVKSHLWYTAQKSIKAQQPTLLSGVPVPKDMGAAGEAIGQGIKEAVTDPKLLSNLASKFITQEVPISEITLSKDVPNFKKGADEKTGVVPGEELKGKYERLATGPIVLWERLNGSKDIITGRHRFDLAKRSGETTIPAQIIKESDGFTKEQAQALDAEANIRGEKGSITDYARYFRGKGMSAEDATTRGLLSRPKGKSGFSVGNDASDSLYNLLTAGKISDKAAAEIALNAPKNEAVQVAAASRAGSMTPEELGQLSRTLSDMRPKTAQGSQGDLFGFDDSAIKEASAISKEAVKQYLSNNVKQ